MSDEVNQNGDQEGNQESNEDSDPEIAVTDACAGCLETAYEKGEPLCRPCACRGSHNLYHYSCLVERVRAQLSINCGLCGQRFREPRIRVAPITFNRWFFSWSIITLVAVIVASTCSVPILGYYLYRAGAGNLEGYVGFSLFVLFIAIMGVWQVVGMYYQWCADNEMGFLEYETTSGWGRRWTVAYGWTRDIRRENRQQLLETIISSLRAERIDNRDRFENLAYFLALLYVLTFPQDFGLPYGILSPMRPIAGEHSGQTGVELVGRENDAAVDAAVRELMRDILDRIARDAAVRQTMTGILDMIDNQERDEVVGQTVTDMLAVIVNQSQPNDESAENDE